MIELFSIAYFLFGFIIIGIYAGIALSMSHNAGWQVLKKQFFTKELFFLICLLFCCVLIWPYIVWKNIK